MSAKPERVEFTCSDGTFVATREQAERLREGGITEENSGEYSRGDLDENLNGIREHLDEAREQMADVTEPDPDDEAPWRARLAELAGLMGAAYDGKSLYFNFICKQSSTGGGGVQTIMSMTGMSALMATPYVTLALSGSVPAVMPTTKPI